VPLYLDFCNEQHHCKLCFSSHIMLVQFIYLRHKCVTQYRYGTGISAGSSPRAISATNGGAEALNKVLVSRFRLAYAGEDLMRIVDTSDINHIKDRLNGFDGCILGTTYQLEQRSVSLNTYEKNPNDKTFELYLDERYGVWEKNVPSDDADIHTSIFRNSVQACKEAGISHLLVVETPRTVRPMDFVKILEEEGVAYTYMRTMSALKKDKEHFRKGDYQQIGSCPPSSWIEFSLI